jgi:hypothetical protein
MVVEYGLRMIIIIIIIMLMVMVAEKRGYLYIQFPIKQGQLYVE